MAGVYDSPGKREDGRLVTGQVRHGRKECGVRPGRRWREDTSKGGVCGIRG